MRDEATHSVYEAFLKETRDACDALLDAKDSAGQFSSKVAEGADGQNKRLIELEWARKAGKKAGTKREVGKQPDKC